MESLSRSWYHSLFYTYAAAKGKKDDEAVKCFNKLASTRRRMVGLPDPLTNTTQNIIAARKTEAIL
jgi:hypothetical protein